MSINNLPYIADVQKQLFHKYIENKDVIGLATLLVVLQARLLHHIIEQLEYIIQNNIVVDPTNYLIDVKNNYKKFLELI